MTTSKMNQQFFNELFTKTEISHASSYGLNLSSKLSLDDILGSNYVFHEVFNKSKLGYIINNYDELYCRISESRNEIHKGCSLTKYYHSSCSKRGDNGYDYVPVKYEQNCTFLTRYQAEHSQSQQAIIREMKQVICNEYYYDIDMINAHPCMIVWLCKHLDLECNVVKEYVANRDKHIADLIAINPGHVKDDFKRLFLRSQYGCGQTSFDYFDYEESKQMNRIKHTEFVKKYYDFFKSFSKTISELFPEFYKSNVEKRIADKKKYNYDGGCLSQLMLYIENKCLMMMIKHLNDNDKYKHFINSLVLCFDGFMIRKDVFFRKSIVLDHEALVLELNKMFKDIGIEEVRVSLKEMSDHPELMEKYDDTITYKVAKPTAKKPKVEYDASNELLEGKSAIEKSDIICQVCALKAAEMDNRCIRDDNGIDFYDITMRFDSFTINEITKLVLQTIARIDNAGDNVFMVKTYTEKVFLKDKDINNLVIEEIVKSISYQIREPKKLCCLNIKVSYQDEVVSVRLINILKELTPFITYKTVVMEPYGCLSSDKAYDRKCFNIFPGLIHGYEESFEVDMSIVETWTSHIKNVICNGDVGVYEYMLQYFKHLLLNPMMKTGVVILVKGKQGSGKNIGFDVFYRYVLGHSLSLVSNRMDDITGRFNSIRESLICCCLDEAVDNQDKKAMNAFKNLITSDNVIIERKGKDAFTLRDFTNYVVISNNNFASFIEESDRRSLCLETNNDKIGDTEYFDNYASTLNNLEAGKHIFHWLVNDVYLPNKWHPQQFPTTKYKQELKRVMCSSVIKYLLCKLNSVEDEEDFIFNNTSTELFKSYVEFCDKNKYKVLNQTAFTTTMKDHWEEKKAHGKRLKCFSKLSLLESLKSYL